MNTESTKPQYGICVRNEECEDLDIRKIYRLLPDKKAAREGYVRVVDESGEDYLYPKSFFVPVSLPRRAQCAVLAST